MKQGRFSTALIVRILRETDQDSLAVVAKRHGVSDATSYIWRKKFGQLINRFGPVPDVCVGPLWSSEPLQRCEARFLTFTANLFAPLAEVRDQFGLLVSCHSSTAKLCW